MPDVMTTATSPHHSDEFQARNVRFSPRFQFFAVPQYLVVNLMFIMAMIYYAYWASYVRPGVLFPVQMTGVHKILDPSHFLTVDVLNPPDRLSITDLAKVPLCGSQVRVP